jgi:hypothetical protein
VTSNDVSIGDAVFTHGQLNVVGGCNWTNTGRISLGLSIGAASSLGKLTIGEGSRVTSQTAVVGARGVFIVDNTGRLEITGPDPSPNTGALEIQRTAESDGKLVVRHGNWVVMTQGTVDVDGELSGDGTIQGNVRIEANGTIAPGYDNELNGQHQRGSLHIIGSMYGDYGNLEFELGPFVSDSLRVDGNVDLSETNVEITLAPGFLPAGGQVFDLLESGTATIDTINFILPALPEGRSWDTSDFHNAGILRVFGPDISSLDLSGNHIIDMADLVLGREFGISQSSLNQIRHYFGCTVNPGQGGSTVTVPEPGAMLLALTSWLAAAIFMTKRRGTRN